MRNEVDYELSRYDVYESYTELFLNQGLAKEARLFDSWRIFVSRRRNFCARLKRCSTVGSKPNLLRKHPSSRNDINHKL